MKQLGSLKTTDEHYLKVIHLIADANILILIALSA